MCCLEGMAMDRPFVLLYSYGTRRRKSFGSREAAEVSAAELQRLGVHREVSVHQKVEVQSDLAARASGLLEASQGYLLVRQEEASESAKNIGARIQEAREAIPGLLEALAKAKAALAEFNPDIPEGGISGEDLKKAWRRADGDLMEAEVYLRTLPEDQEAVLLSAQVLGEEVSKVADEARRVRSLMEHHADLAG